MTSCQHCSTSTCTSVQELQARCLLASCVGMTQVSKVLPVFHLQLQEESEAQLSVVMGGNPSGRGQTLLLAEWLREQVSACTIPQSTATGMQTSRELNASRMTLNANDQRSRAAYTHKAAVADNMAAHESSASHGLTASGSAAAAGSAGGSMPDQKRQEQHKMRQDPDLSLPGCSKAAACSPRATTGDAQAGGSTWAPHLLSSVCQQSLASWQGLLPQGCESLGSSIWAEEIVKSHPDQGKRVLGVLGGGYGLLVHQVAMHCFERGALMAGIWNIYTALMDAELHSLEEHVKVLLLLQTLHPQKLALTKCFSKSTVAFVALQQWQTCLNRTRQAPYMSYKRFAWHICGASE